MANVFKPKRSNTASSVPTTSNLDDGELAVNSADKIIYLRDGSTIVEVANFGGGSATIPGSSSTTTIVADDNGKLVTITGGVTIADVFTTIGENVVIYNNSTSIQTITQGSGVTLRLAGTASTGDRTITQRGLATVVFVGSGVYVISGAGVQ